MENKKIRCDILYSENLLRALSRRHQFAGGHQWEPSHPRKLHCSLTTRMHSHDLPFPGAEGRWVPRLHLTRNKSFGHFQCQRCKSRWSSAHAFKAYGQQCKKCKRMEQACCMWENTESDRPRDVAEEEEGEQRPHRSDLCQVPYPFSCAPPARSCFKSRADGADGDTRRVALASAETRDPHRPRQSLLLLASSVCAERIRQTQVPTPQGATTHQRRSFSGVSHFT